jgi:hypothetical protein
MSILASWLASPPIDAAIEIAPAAVPMPSWASGHECCRPGYAVEPLPPGAVVPSLTASNIADRAAVVRALAAACQSVGVKPSHCRAGDSGPRRQGVAGSLNRRRLVATTWNSSFAGR